MSVTIHGRRSSANIQKVIWLSTEAGISFKTIDVGGKYNEKIQKFSLK